MMRRLLEEALGALNSAPRFPIIGSTKDSYELAARIQRYLKENPECSVPANARSSSTSSKSTPTATS